jgi:spore coat polysaccharide biosynthesis predicted glycosyltransferase SpsG
VLRREFLKWKGTSRIISDSVQKILVTLGGSDPDNATLSVIEALKNIGMKGIEVIVIVGGLNPNSDLIVRSISDYDSFSLRTDVRNMPELMAWADLVITGGGSTCWELIFMRQKPLVIVIAENQRKIAEGLDAAGEAYYIGTSHDITVRQLTEKIRNALSVYEKKDRSVVIGGGLVDGSGGARIVREMERRSGGSS